MPLALSDLNAPPVPLLPGASSSYPLPGPFAWPLEASRVAIPKSFSLTHITVSRKYGDTGDAPAMWDSLAHCLRLRPKKDEVESPQDLLLHPELTFAESNHLPLVHSQQCTGFRVSYWFQLWLGRHHGRKQVILPLRFWSLPHLRRGIPGLVVLLRPA